MNGVAYIAVVLGILIAKGLGFFRDIVFASVFGASVYTDMYFQIFGLVNLIFTGIGVALSTLVIKNVNKAELSSEEAKRGYVSYFIKKSVIISICAIAVMYVGAGAIVKLLLPGLNPENFSLAVKLVYIMLPSLLFVIIAYIISGVLQNSKVFFISSIMSLPFNVVIIASLFFKNVDIVTVSIVTTIGWFLHIVIQLPSFYKKGYRFFLPYGKPVGKKNRADEILWIFISNMMFQICFIIDKAFVSGESGMASAINYASNLFVTIASVFVVAMSNVVFPSISRNYEEGNIEYVKNLLKYMITVMFAIFTPFILTVTCFGKNIIALLYERGSFTSELTEVTATLLAIYTLGAFGYVCQELFNKILYLDSRYSYTVIGTILVIGIKPAVNMFFGSGGVYAIAIGTTVLFTIYAVNIAIAIKNVVGNYIDFELIKNISKIIFAGICALVVFWCFKMFASDVLNGRATFTVALALCGVVYCVALLLSGIVKTIVQGRGADNPQ